MANKPKYRIGDKVKAANVTGSVIKVWTVNPDVYRYTIKTASGKSVLNEDELNRA